MTEELMLTDPNETWFTADNHFHHKNVIKYCHRPFSNVEEMDETMVKNWNDRVSIKGIVYHLGDFGFGKCSDILERLNGRIILIEGSHDSHIMKECKDKFFQINTMRTITILRQQIVLCHYAMRRWSKSHYGSWHLYGHSHGKLPPYGKSFDVGVDCHGFAPISFFEVQAKMDLLKEQSEEVVS